MANQKGPFENAKVGDWIITSTGKVHQIQDIVSGEFGGVRIGKYRGGLIPWNGIRFSQGRSRSEPTASRLATPEEITDHLREKEEASRKMQEERKEEERLERIRDAAPAMLAALTAAEPILRAYIPADQFDGHAAEALRLVSAAIAQAKGE